MSFSTVILSILCLSRKSTKISVLNSWKSQIDEVSENLIPSLPGPLGRIVQLIPGRTTKLKLINIQVGKTTIPGQFADATGVLLWLWYTKALRAEIWNSLPTESLGFPSLIELTRISLSLIFVNSFEPMIERKRSFTDSDIAFVMIALYVPREYAPSLSWQSRVCLTMSTVFFRVSWSLNLFSHSVLLSRAHRVASCLKRRILSSVIAGDQLFRLASAEENRVQASDDPYDDVAASPEMTPAGFVIISFPFPSGPIS